MYYYLETVLELWRWVLVCKRFRWHHPKWVVDGRACSARPPWVPRSALLPVIPSPDPIFVVKIFCSEDRHHLYEFLPIQLYWFRSRTWCIANGEWWRGQKENRLCRPKRILYLTPIISILSTKLGALGNWNQFQLIYFCVISLAYSYFPSLPCDTFYICLAYYT